MKTLLYEHTARGIDPPVSLGLLVALAEQQGRRSIIDRRPCETLSVESEEWRQFGMTLVTHRLYRSDPEPASIPGSPVP